MFRLMFTALTGLLLSLPSAQAADVYVVHGVNGKDLGLDEALFVDLNIDGECVGTAKFGDVIGPLDFGTGTAKLSITLGKEFGGGATCDGLPVAALTLDLSVFETAIVVAHLDANGVVRLSRFTADTGELDPGTARATVIHAAKAPAVNVRAGGGGKSGIRIRGLTNGEQSFSSIVAEGSYTFRIVPSGFSGVTLEDVPLAGNAALVAVGSLDKGTFTVIPVPIQ